MFDILMSVALLLFVLHYSKRLEVLEERLHELESPHRWSTGELIRTLSGVVRRSKKKSK